MSPVSTCSQNSVWGSLKRPSIHYTAGETEAHVGERLTLATRADLMLDPESTTLQFRTLPCPPSCLPPSFFVFHTLFLWDKGTDS